MTGHPIIAIGASAGGVIALRELVSQLPASLPAALLVVVHTAPDSPGLLGHILDSASPLPAMNAEDKMVIEIGRIYVAPPDHHLLVKNGQTRLARGPRINRSRPAIDPLFRSVAVNYGPHAVGVILSGSLDDGTAGLWAIKQCNGMTIVQDPNDALYPDMPAHALEHVQPDYMLPLSEIGSQLSAIVHEPAKEWVPVPKHVALETKMMEKEIQEEDITAWGAPVSMSCPACGGPLLQLTEVEQPPRYRCIVGHGYTVHTLLEDQDEAVEQALWTALRTLKERSKMLENLAATEAKNGRHKAASTFQESAQTANSQAELLQTVLEKVHDR